MTDFIKTMYCHIINVGQMLDGEYESEFYVEKKREISEALSNGLNGYQQDKLAIKEDIGKIGGDMRKAVEKAKETFAF